ncbi:Asp-tRNA(Asn)/Glu-tRNA(Gln) amidotransferase subunit GatA [Lentibacillus lipolyticus]|nr:Asp-tRNA(Asn)/Glu-tRNA(Gln) amidotransferase subunit GatA [Lentibacillus lipolyticus]
MLNWDIKTLASSLQRKEVSPVEVTEKMLERMNEKNEELNAYVTITNDLAMKQAKAAEQEIMNGNYKGPLHGVPIALKDNFLTKNIKTTIGSEIFKDYLPSYDGEVVKKLADAGSVMLGKLNMHEFAYGTTGDRSYFGAVKNSYDHSKMSGGSSSGSGTAVADALSYAALGTDTGGSIRIPSAYNGIVGMKPTFGRVSNRGIFPLSWTLDHTGPMTKTVYDNALLLTILSGYDAEDPYSVKTAEQDFTAALGYELEDITIGVPTNKFFQTLDDEVKTSFNKAIETYKKLGCQVIDIEFPEPDNIIAAFRTIMQNEAYTLHEERLQKYPDQWGTEVKERLLSATDAKARDLVQAQQIRQKAIRTITNLFEKEEMDIIITPTVPIMPRDIDEREAHLNGETIPISLLLNKFTGLFNATGFPSLSLPSYPATSSLPIGIQLTGNSFDESKIYQIAFLFEKELHRS